MYNFKTDFANALTNIKNANDLFNLWKKAHSEEIDTHYLNSNIPKDIFIPDGIIDPQKYNESKLKVLFIAKEANWFQADSDLSLNETYDTMFWHREVAFERVDKTNFSYRLAMLANAVISAETTNYTVINKNHDVLKSIAFMNLNKRGGYAYCIWDTLNNYVNIYQDFIRQQIDMIKPDLIICCGYDVKWLLDEYKLAPDSTPLIWVYHPSYFAISDQDYLNQLKCAMTGDTWTALNKSVPAEFKKPTKGIIFDTNRTYSAISTMDMLLNNKISAYDDAAHLVDSFEIGDYVFYSTKGLGVVAAGKIVSDAEEVTYKDGLYEKYKVVDFIVPKPEDIPHGEESLKGLSWIEITSALEHDFYKARTDKRPYLTESECSILIELMQEKL